MKKKWSTNYTAIISSKTNDKSLTEKEKKTIVVNFTFGMWSPPFERNCLGRNGILPRIGMKAKVKKCQLQTLRRKRC